MQNSNFSFVEDTEDLSQSFSKSLTTKTKKIKKLSDKPNEKEKEKKKLEESFQTYRKKLFTDFQSEIMKWTNLTKFTHKATFMKEEITREKIMKQIVGHKNIIILFITTSMCSFGVFESREIPEPKETLLDRLIATKNARIFANGYGNHFIFSLDNYQCIPFIMNKKEENMRSGDFLGVFRENNQFALDIKEFGVLDQNGNFGVRTFDEISTVYDSGKINGLDDFFGPEIHYNDRDFTQIELDSIMIYEGN